MCVLLKCVAHGGEKNGVQILNVNFLFLTLHRPRALTHTHDLRVPKTGDELTYWDTEKVSL